MFGKRPKNNLLVTYLKQSGQEFLDEVNFLKKRRRTRRLKNLKIILLTIGLVLLFLILNVAVFYPSLRTCYDLTKQGKEHLNAAIFALKAGQIDEARQLSERATAEWRGALQRLQRFRFTPAGWLPYLSIKITDAGHLLEAGFKLSRANLTIVQSGQSYLPLLFEPKANFTKLSLENKGALLAELSNSFENLSRASQDLQDALSSLESVTSPEIFNYLEIEQTQIIEAVRYDKQVIDQVVPLSQLLPAFLGYPADARYLLIFQNRDELRPTGGFIGTIGLMEVTNGEVKRLDTKDVYHLDMPAFAEATAGKPVDNIFKSPPAPLVRYLDIDSWYLRDANWSPDWQVSAQQITKFYLAENKLLPNPDPLVEFDFVVGITADLIIDLLKITGPLTLPDGQVYDQNNFVDLLQDTTGKEFANLGISRWQRKAVVGQLAKLLQQKLLADLDQHWVELFAALTDNLNAKNIIIYARQPAIDYLLSARNWTGEVQPTEGDYLMVVDANLAALKTDAVISRHFNYELQETPLGLKARLTLNYSNTGEFSWKTTRYRSYTRVYAPKGSILTKASGYMSDTVETGEDLGKTWFGVFLSVEPGALGNLTFEYLLPEMVRANYRLGKYQLLWQKQPGSKVQSAKVDLGFSNELKSYSPARFYSYRLGDSRVVWETDLVTDKNFTVNFK